MQQDDIPPTRAEPNSSNPENPAAAPAMSTLRWFNSRPIPVFIIAAWCILQFIGILVFLTTYWQDATELVRTGAESPIAFVVKLLYPTILFWAGVLLVMMRKAAIFAFACYLAWGCFKVFTQQIPFPDYLSLALVAGFVVYCLRLQQQGRLR